MQQSFRVKLELIGTSDFSLIRSPGLFNFQYRARWSREKHTQKCCERLVCAGIANQSMFKPLIATRCDKITMSDSILYIAFFFYKFFMWLWEIKWDERSQICLNNRLSLVLNSKGVTKHWHIITILQAYFIDKDQWEGLSWGKRASIISIHYEISKMTLITCFNVIVAVVINRFLYTFPIKTSFVYIFTSVTC